MCCAEAIIKIFLYLFNLAFFLCGAVLFSVGIYLVVADDGIALIDGLGLPSADGASEIWTVAVYLLISLGAFIFIVGFIGCTGVKTKNKCLVFFFVSLILICLVAEIVAAVMAVVYKGRIDAELSGEMTTEVKTKYRWQNETSVQSGDEVSYAWNLMQYKMKCCGAGGYKDYRGSLFTNSTMDVVPFSCCVMKDRSQLAKEDVMNLDSCKAGAQKDEPTVDDAKYLHVEGCYTIIKDWIEDHALIIMAAGFSFATFQILGVLLGCCITNLWGKDA